MQREIMNDLADSRLEISACQTRRRFIRHFAVGTALSAVLGKISAATVLASLQPATGDGILSVRIADYPALQEVGGSVRLAFNPFTENGPLGPFYPVLINRGPGDAFFTLSAQCQHQSCVVPIYNAAAGSSACPCHGSQYAINGSVRSGPTVRPLIAYPNSFDGAQLDVQIPKLGFSITATAVPSGAGRRFQFNFPTLSKVKYQILFRKSLDDPGTPALFSLTSDGPASSATVTGTGAAANVFVDRTTDAGFYTVAVVVTEG